MPLRGNSWQEITWSWAFSTGHSRSDQTLEAAAKAAWPYSVLCAWTYLFDQDMAHDLMEHAIRNTSEYLVRHSDANTPKLTARLKSVLRRRAKQLAKRRGREVAAGSSVELDKISQGRSEIEERMIANEIFSQLSEFAQNVVNWRWLGYTWREIGKELDMDYASVRRAYFRELHSTVAKLDHRGDI